MDEIIATTVAEINDSTAFNLWERLSHIFTESALSMPSFRISDFIDIAIVTVLIYLVLCWVKETRAWTLVKGLLIIACVSIISSVFHFYTLSWIIEKTFSVGIIAIVILFQPEFRKALEQIGTGSFKGISDIIMPEKENNITKDSVDELVDACVKLSAVRTGALIVIERNVPLGEFLKTGINVDASISSQLLINIFEKNTPLHDGAVVIQNNRVKAATCILPVTQNQIGLELGTRHRAAVGASEVSDACVVIVSEETGAISVAEGGKLKKNIGEKELRRLLTYIAVGDEKISRKLLRGKLKNEKNT